VKEPIGRENCERRENGRKETEKLERKEKDSAS
jgi:hypothetical protein